MYFTRRLDARIVLVHLSPKEANNQSDTFTGPRWLPDINSYMGYHTHFGETNYGPQAKRRHVSQFDNKQIRFLRPFQIIPFVPEHSLADRRTNRMRAIDEKLQLELLPYSSDTSETQRIPTTVLTPHISRILNVIFAAPRDYVIFCGQIFERLFHDSITQQYAFYRLKKDQTSSKSQSRFCNLQLAHQGKIMQAGIAISFAKQGLPMEAYGQQCYERYGAHVPLT